MDFNPQEEVKKQEVQQVVDKARNPPKKAPSALDQIAINDAIANRTVSSLGDNRINLRETGTDADMNAAYTRIGDEYRAKYDTFTRGINNEERAAQNQSVWDQYLNGIGKNVGKAVLYALDGVVGFPLGVVKGLSEGSMSAAWDNSFSRKVDELGKQLDVSLPNYMTENEKNMGFLKSLGNANFWANDVLGGVAFMAGAIGSEFIWAGITGGSSLALSAAKAAGKTARAVRSLDDVARFATNTKKMMADLARNASSASNRYTALHNTRFLITSSGFESSIESRHSLDESLYNFQQAIQAQHGRTPTAEEYGKFMPDAVSQANNVFAANMAILAPSNAVMFGGLFGVNWKLPGILSKAGGRLTGVGMNSIDDAGKILWKEIIPTKAQKFVGYTASIIKKPLVEGVYEEGFQGVASKASQNYLASKYDPSALKDNYGLIESVRDAFGQMYGTKEGRKEIGIGMIIGALGGSRSSFKAQKAAYANQAPLAEQRNSLNATMDKATTGLLRRMLDVNQLNTAMKKAHQEAAVGNTTVSAMYFDKAQFAKMNMENGADMLEESVKNFQTMLENSPVSSLAAEYGIPEDSVKDVKTAILEQYVQNAKDYKTAMKAAEALVPTIKDYEKGGKSRDLIQELALNMYLGGKSSERASTLAQSIEEATGQSGIASHLKFFSNVTREAKNSAEAVRVATKRIKALSDDLALLQQEYSTLQETAPRTQENNTNAKKVEANRRKYGKTQQVLTERAAELEELKRTSQANPLIQDYAFGDILQNDMVGIDAIADSLDQLEKLDSYLIELEKSSPRAARSLSHMLSEYANNISAFEQFNIVYNKLSDERFNFKSYKGIAKVFSTKGKYTFAPKNPTPKQELTEEFIRDNNIDEYDAFGLRLLDDLSNKVYSLDVADIEAELLNGDPVSLEEWNDFLTNNTVSDEIKADIARKVFEGENLSNREQRIQEANQALIDDTVKQLRKDKGDSIRKARKPKNAVINTTLTGAARIRDLISQILSSKNYLSQFDVDDVSKADVPTEEEYRELNKLLKAPRLSAKRQARLKELLDKTNKWGEIEGTFSGKHKLGELYNLLFAYEQDAQETVTDETAEIPITETMHEETFEGATRKDNYNHLQVYDKVFFTKDKNGNYYISNLTFNGLLELLPSYTEVVNRNKTFAAGTKVEYKKGDVLSVKFDDGTAISFSITNRGNIQITEASKNWMNTNTNIQISPLSVLPTNYFTVLRRVNGTLVPLATDIEIVFDVKAVQGLKKGDTVFAQVVKSTFNKGLLSDYNKATDKAAALVTLAKNLLIQFVDNKNNLMGILKAEYDLESANSASDFQAVSEFRRDAAQKFLENKDFETIDLEKAVKVIHVYNGHPVLDIRDENGKFVVHYNKFTDATLENIVDTGYIENGKVVLRNNTDRTTDSFVYTIKANKNGKYTNKRVPIVVVNFNGLNIVYPVKLIPSVVDNSSEIDAILNKPISNAEKAQQIIEFLIKNKVNVSALNIMPDNLTAEKILEIKKTLLAQNKFIDVSEFASKENDMGELLKENASINIDLKGDMFHSPKVVIELTEETNNEEPLFETVTTLSSKSEIEDRIADIERRRQEELNKETPVKNENIIVNDGTDNLTFKIITFKDGSTLVRHIKTNETTADNKSKKLITYPTLEDFQNLLKYNFDENAKIIKTELVKDDYTDKQSQEVKATKEKTINAKYDAEYVDKVKKGEFTAQQAKDALKEINRLTPELSKQLDDAELAALERRRQEVERLSNKELTSPTGKINTGKIEIPILSSQNIDKTIYKDNKGVEYKVKANFKNLQDVLLGRNGKYLFRGMKGRFFVLAKVGDFYLPFYISSAGTSGKKQGEWYPFFGYTGNWLVKGSVGNKGEMEYSQKISEVQKLLQENLQFPSRFLNLKGEMKVGDNVIYDINQDFNYIEHFTTFGDGTVKREGDKYPILKETLWIQEITGFDPRNVNNDGKGSADAWINDIIALIENAPLASKGKINAKYDAEIEVLKQKGININEQEAFNKAYEEAKALGLTGQQRDEFIERKQKEYENSLPSVPVITPTPIVEQITSAEIETLFARGGKEAREIFDRTVRNIAKRLGIPLKKYLERLSIITTNREVQQTVNSILNRSLNGDFMINTDDNAPSEVLFQSDEEKNRIIQAVPSLDVSRDALLIEALGKSEGFRKILDSTGKSVNESTRREIGKVQSELSALFKAKEGNSDKGVILQEKLKTLKDELKQTETLLQTYSKEQVLSLLNNEIESIVDRAKNTDDFYIKDFSDKFISVQIDFEREQGNEAKAQEWEYIRDNKGSSQVQDEIKAQRLQQQSALLLGLNYITTANEYSTEFKFVMIDAVLNYNINAEGYLSKRTENTVALHNEMSSGVLPAVQDVLNENPSLHPISVYQQNRLKGFMNAEERKSVATKYIVETRPTGYWLKFPKDASEEVVNDLYLMAKETHQNSPNGSWCTGGSVNTAKSHNSQGDFYIFVDKAFNTRLAMKYTGSDLAESRGLGEGQLVLNEDLDEAGHFYKNYPNATKFEKTRQFNLLYNKYKDGAKLEEKDVITIAEIYKNGDGSYADDGEKGEYLLEVLKKNKETVEKVFGSEVLFRIEPGQTLDGSEVFIGRMSNFNITGSPKILYGDYVVFNDSPKSLTLPTIINGNLSLGQLTTSEGLILPTIINGSLELGKLTTAKGLIFPKVINGSLFLNELRTVDGLNLPTTINGSLNLRNLTTANGLILPKIIEGYLNLSGLTTVEGVILPEEVYGNLFLNSLYNTVDLVLPKIVTGNLDLGNLLTVGGVKFPKEVKNLILNSVTLLDESTTLPLVRNRIEIGTIRALENIDLSNTKELELRNVEILNNVKLPKILNESLNFPSLKEIKNVEFPETIDGFLDLRSLEIAEGFTLPTSINGGVYLNNLKTTLTVINGTIIDGFTIRSETDAKMILGYSNTPINFIDVLNQSQKGAIIKSKESSVIVLGKDADITTPLHEIAHEYERVLTKEEKATILKWAGHKKWTRDTSEAFARGFEKYLFEGKAENDTEGIFKRFAVYLKELIQDAISYFGGINELSQDMIDIYSIMTATETAPMTEQQTASTTEATQIDMNMSEEKSVSIMESIKSNPDTAKTLTNREANILFRKYDAYFSNLNKKADEEFQANIETIKALPQAEKTKVLDEINNNRTETLKKRAAYDKLLDSAGLDRFNLGGNINAPETYHFTSAESVINMLEDDTLSGNEQEDEGYGGISTTTNKDFDNPFFATVKQYGAMFSVVSDFSESAVNITLDLNALKQDGYTAIKGNENMGTFAGEEEVRIIKKGEGQKARDVSETEINTISKYIKEIILDTEKLSPEEIAEIKTLAKKKGINVSEKQKVAEKAPTTEVLGDSKVELVKKFADTYNIIYNNKTIGTIDIPSNLEGDTISIGDVNINPEFRGKGLGVETYKAAIKIAGKPLESFIATEEANRVWNSLVKQGLAKKTETGFITLLPQVSKEQKAAEKAPITEVSSGIKSSFESNIEALINPQTGLSSTVTRILDAQQPLKDAFLNSIGLSIEDYQKLDEDGKQKIQDQWVKSKEFEQLSKQPLPQKSRIIFLPNPGSFQDREMHFIEGEWKQKVGKEFTSVSTTIQEQAARVAEENFPALSEKESNITVSLINKQC